MLRCKWQRTLPPLLASVGGGLTICMSAFAALFTTKFLDRKGADALKSNQHGGTTAATTQWSVATLLGGDSEESHRTLTALPTSMPAGFFRTVRSARSRFWEGWLSEVELLSARRPRESARACRQQFAVQSSSLPTHMDWPERAQDADDLDAAREAWRDHFAGANQAADLSESSISHRIARRSSRLLEDHPAENSPLDAAFHVAELLRALPHCHDSAVGPDGIPYAAFRVAQPWWHEAITAFCNLVLLWGIVPSSWKDAHIVPLHKRGERRNPANYRPISLTSCFARLFERMILQRISPVVDPQLDSTQAGFRWGSDEHAYVLGETLRLRPHCRTFCAFVDLKNAFGTCWIDAALCKLHRAGVSGSLWKLIADFCSNGRSCVSAYGGLSHFGSDSGLGQGRVLSPLLFNLVMNGAAVAVQRTCQGVRIGQEPGGPRVTTLLYADDLVILAETPEELQTALDALAAWARDYGFSFSAGPEKSAVMVFHGRHQQLPPFKLGGLNLPFVSSYRYLGVVFSSNGRWTQHVEHMSSRSNHRFATCVAWAQREKLHLAWTARLFQVYVLDAFLFGAELIATDAVALRALGQQLRRLGRRILGWPSGSLF